MVYQKMDDELKTKYVLVLTSRTTDFCNLIFHDNRRISKCPTSKYFKVASADTDLCLKINLTRFPLKVKPFGFIVHVGLYPPDYITKYIIRFHKEWIYPACCISAQYSQSTRIYGNAVILICRQLYGTFSWKGGAYSSGAWNNGKMD